MRLSLEIIPLAHKMQVEFRSHFSEKKVRLMGQEIGTIVQMLYLHITM